MTTLQFAQELWRTTQPIGYIMVGIWTVILLDAVERKAHGKVKGQEGQIVRPQKESLENLQHLYQNERLSENHRDDRQRRLRHMPQDIRI